MKQVFLLQIIFTLFLIPCLAQQKVNSAEIVEETKPFNINDYVGWQKIDLKPFSFYVPKGLKRIEQRCIDSDYCDRFVGKDFAVSIDISPSAYRLSYEKNSQATVKSISG